MADLGLEIIKCIKEVIVVNWKVFIEVVKNLKH